LRDFLLPNFDEHIFSVMLADKWRGMPNEDTIKWLQRDPVISIMPALHDMVFPESWKSGIILALEKRNILVSASDIAHPVDRMAKYGRFSLSQAEKLKVHCGPLEGEPGLQTTADVLAEVASARLVSLHSGFDRLAPEAVRSGKGCSRQNGARDEDSARITQEDQAWDQTNDLMAHLASTGQNLCAEVLDAPEVGRDYVHFSLPTLDDALVVAAAQCC